MTTKSAVDLWIVMLLWANAALMLLTGVVMILVAGVVGWLICVVVVLFGAGVPLWMMNHTTYRLGGQHLHVECGPLRWRVRYRDIRSVTRQRSLLAGPAFSMDRLVIEYGPMRCLVISPEEPEAFRLALAERIGKLS